MGFHRSSNNAPRTDQTETRTSLATSIGPSRGRAGNAKGFGGQRRGKRRDSTAKLGQHVIARGRSRERKKKENKAIEGESEIGEEVVVEKGKTVGKETGNLTSSPLLFLLSVLLLFLPSRLSFFLPCVVKEKIYVFFCCC